jgi:hypothetical protein
LLPYLFCLSGTTERKRNEVLETTLTKHNRKRWGTLILFPVVFAFILKIKTYSGKKLSPEGN